MEKQNSKDSQQKENNEGEIVKLGTNIIGKDHEFAYISGTEVMCKKCPLGYVVGAETTVKDGHIYIKNKLVI